MTERIDRTWVVGPYEIQAVKGHGFPMPEYPEVMYRYKINGERVDSEMYVSLDRALVAAVGARHMGPRGANGNAVGTAADWFCVMVGLDEDEREARPEPEREPEPELEPEPAVTRMCPGAGRAWAAFDTKVGTVPVCVHCLSSPQLMGEPTPERNGLGFLGLVPAHELDISDPD